MPAVTPLTALPHFITKEQHDDILSSTPPSLSDIPPALRLELNDVTVVLDPPVQGLLPPEPKGTLYVIDSVLAFIDASTHRGFQIQYPKITLHAIARTDAGPSIYCQLDEQEEDTEKAETNEDSPMSELRIFPAHAEAVEIIFDAMSECAALHPDPGADGDDGEFSDGDAEGGFEVFDGGPEEELSEVGRAALAHLESIIQSPVVSGSVQGNEEAGKEEEEDSPRVNGKETAP